MIKDAVKFVNDLSDYQLNSILLQSAISKLPGMHDYPEKSVKIDDNSYIRFHEIPKSEKQICHLGIPDSKQLTLYHRPLEAKKLTPREEIFPEFFKQARKGHVTARCALEAYQTQLKRAPCIMQQFPDKSGNFFFGAIKGSAKYNDRRAYILKKQGEFIQSMGGFFYFLTITYDIKTHGKDQIKAWQLFRDHCSTTLRALRDKYKIQYIGVLESTTKGYPHAHIVLRTEEDIGDGKKEIKGGEPITRGILFQHLQEIVRSRVFLLQHAVPSKLQNYLIKYVSKGVHEIGKLSNSGQVRLSKSKRKSLYSCMYPVCARVRQFFCSRAVSAGAVMLITGGVQDAGKSKNISDSKPDGNVSTEERLLQAAARAAEYLIWILTNPTETCECSCFLRASDYKNGNSPPVEGYYSELPEKERIFWQYFGKPLGCPGCHFSRWQKKQDYHLRNAVIRDIVNCFYNKEEQLDREEYLADMDADGSREAAAQEYGYEYLPIDDPRAYGMYY